MMEQNLRLESLEIGYRRNIRGNRIVARGLTAVAEAGRLTCLIGDNGVGKSTLLRTIAGLQPVLGGQVFIGDNEVGKMTVGNRARQLSIVLTQRPDTMRLTVRELVGLGRYPYTNHFGTQRDTDEAVVDEAIRRVGIETLANRLVGRLSDGEQQKAVIAKTLAQQTPVILLDEPTAFLDYHSREELMGLLASLAHNEGKTVLLSSHDHDLLGRYADDCWLMTADGIIQVDVSLLLAVPTPCSRHLP